VVQFAAGAGDFSFVLNVQAVPRAHPAYWVPRARSPGVKRLERGEVHSYLALRVRMSGDLLFTPPPMF
jgi:hypothetical protein